MPLEKLLALAQQQADQRQWSIHPGAVYRSAEFGVLGVGFFEPGGEHGDGGLGNPWLYFDDQSGDLLGDDVPGKGTAGDIFLQAMYPLHSGRIIGLPGRILVSGLGLAVSILCVTGVVIWIRKRSARQKHARNLMRQGEGGLGRADIQQ